MSSFQGNCTHERIYIMSAAACCQWPATKTLPALHLWKRLGKTWSKQTDRDPAPSFQKAIGNKNGGHYRGNLLLFCVFVFQLENAEKCRLPRLSVMRVFLKKSDLLRYSFRWFRQTWIFCLSAELECSALFNTRNPSKFYLHLNSNEKLSNAERNQCFRKGRRRWQEHKTHNGQKKSRNKDDFDCRGRPGTTRDDRRRAILPHSFRV